jgi:Domain of unknown function (DUF4835)
MERQMKRIKRTILLVLIPFPLLFSQVLNISVSMEFGRLSNDEKKDLDGFSDKVEQYYNNYDWVDDEYETDIPCNVRILVETVQKKTYEKIYKAQFLISSESGENFYDKNWEFPYEPSFPLDHSKSIFDPLTNLLDFYAYMVLAGELDTYDHLQGTALYDRALDIASQGLISQYPRGWTQRNDELLMITHVRTRPLREAKPDFFEALYLLDEGDRQGAEKLAEKVYDGIKKVYTAQPNNKYLRVFFEAHHKEIAMLFEGKFDILEELTEIDSKHRATYRQYLPNN